ncbi:MAG: DUF3224 domain-containing protein [Catenulispora sp.]|nr:DUF3224 domain-containing protein [Catenulispora sp.]
MAHSAKALLKWEPWDPEPWDVAPAGPALLRGTGVVHHYTGDLEAVGRAETLISHLPDGSASMVAIERIDGRLGDRTGTFVLRAVGSVAGGVSELAWTVVPGSGTGELAGLHGEGGYRTDHMGRDGHADVELRYDFD